MSALGLPLSDSVGLRVGCPIYCRAIVDMATPNAGLADVRRTLRCELRGKTGRPIDAAMGAVYRGAVARRHLGALHPARHREGANSPRHHGLQSARSLLHAVHPQSAGGCAVALALGLPGPPP